MTDMQNPRGMLHARYAELEGNRQYPWTHSPSESSSDAPPTTGTSRNTYECVHHTRVPINKMPANALSYDDSRVSSHE